MQLLSAGCEDINAANNYTMRCDNYRERQNDSRLNIGVYFYLWIDWSRAMYFIITFSQVNFREVYSLPFGGVLLQAVVRFYVCGTFNTVIAQHK